MYRIQLCSRWQFFTFKGHFGVWMCRQRKMLLFQLWFLRWPIFPPESYLLPQSVQLGFWGIQNRRSVRKINQIWAELKDRYWRWSCSADWDRLSVREYYIKGLHHSSVVVQSILQYQLDWKQISNICVKHSSICRVENNKYWLNVFPKKSNYFYNIKISICIVMLLLY